MDYYWDGDVSIVPEDYIDEKLSEKEKEELYSYQRAFQRLMENIVQSHHLEIKEFVEECLGYIREKYPEAELCECCEEKEGTNARHDCGCKMLCDDCVVKHDRECEDYNEENSQTSESEED